MRNINVQRSLMLGIAVVTVAAFLTIRPAVADDNTVVLASFGGPLETAIRSKVLPGFEKATGIKVLYVDGTAQSNYAKILAARSDPDTDVYWGNELTHTSGNSQGLYAKLDPSLVANLKDVFPEAKDPNGLGVMADYTSTGIMYNPVAMKAAGVAPPTSWADLSNPAYNGKVLLFDFSNAYAQDYLVLQARLHGGGESNAAPGFAAVKALVTSGNVGGFAATPAEANNLIEQGTYWMIPNAAVQALILSGQGAPVAFADPKEGGAFFGLYLNVVKGGPHPKAAQMLVNYLLGEQAQEAIATGTFQTPVNRNVKLSADFSKKISFGEDKLNHLIKLDRAKMNANLDTWTDTWDRDIMGGKQ